MSNHHARGHPNCLTVYIMKKLQEVKFVVKDCMGRTSLSIGGAQLRQKKMGPPKTSMHIHAKMYHNHPKDV